MRMGWGTWLWILIIIGVSYFFFMSYRTKKPRIGTEDPIDIARFRLARGEITTQEFEDIKKSLQK
jgi:putative membrane protein